VSSVELASSTTSASEVHKRAGAGYRRTTVVAAQCRLMLRELSARGLPHERPLAALGIHHAESSDLREFISAAQFEAFLRVAEQLSADPNIGLHAGRNARHEDLDLLGLLLRGSRDVQSAWALFLRYRGTVPHALDLDIVVDDNVLVCRRVMPGVRASRTLSEYFLSRTMTVAELMLGPVEPFEVRMMHAEPLDTQLHHKLLGPRLRFREPEDAIVFPVSILSRPMLHPDPVTTAVLRRHFDSLPGAGVAFPPDLIAYLRRAIQDELQRGRATMTEIAGRLKLSERTLRRQLRELGTSFQHVLDEVRRDEALRELQASRYVVNELSVRLGFAGRAAFYRAFRRWTGMSPAEYRAQRDEQLLHGAAS
jgi:AraC-like DNA-binding protein